MIGGGLAGAAAACGLAARGRRVLLVERMAGPHDKVCGEFVSGEAERWLGELGLAGELDRLGAVPIERLRLVAGRIEASAALPFRACGLSRRRLDAALLDHAAGLGAEVRRGVAARGLVQDGAGLGLDLGGDRLAVGAALLATGKHELRGWARAARPAPLIGLKLHLELAPAMRSQLAGHVELALFAGGYAGLQLVEEGRANLCLVITKERFAGLDRDWRSLVAQVPHLARRLAGAEPCRPQPLAIFRIPYGHLQRGGDGGGPVYRIGDQLAVIPSFTGDGMAMALRSAALATQALAAGRPPAAFHAEATAAFAPSMRLAGLVARLAATVPLQAPLVAACRLLPALASGVAAATRAAA